MKAPASTKKAIALIPARGGSKGIRNKNLVSFSGRPLIAWTIEAARNAQCIQRVVVTTDDPRIRQAARQCGAETIDRPKRLATDLSPTIDATLHAIRRFLKSGADAGVPLAVLQPTSPLRTTRDIEKAFAEFLSRPDGSVIAVQPLAYPPCWAFQETKRGTLKRCAVDPKLLQTRRQDLPRFFGPNGSIYIARLGDVLRKRTLFVEPVRKYVMDAERSIDINTTNDLTQAMMWWSHHRSKR